MTDPLSQVIELLRPRAVFSKGISGAGRWGVRYSEFGQPGFCAVIEGGCRLAVDGEEPVTLEEGDFVLLPATPAFTMSSFEPATPVRIDPKVAPAPTEEVRHGRPRRPSRRSPARRLFHLRFARCGAAGVAAAGDDPRARHPAAFAAGAARRRGGERRARRPRSRACAPRRDPADRGAAGDSGGRTRRPGLLRGLADARVAAGAAAACTAIRERSWTVAELAGRPGCRDRPSSTASPARSGCGRWSTSWPGAWPLRRTCCAAADIALDEVARRVGYGSASTFSTAFSRHAGEPPRQYCAGA